MTLLDTPNPPHRTTEQRTEALRRANAVRLNLASLRRRVASREVDWRDVLTMDDPAARKLRVDHLLQSTPGIGPVTAEQMMRAAGITAAKRVGTLTEEQRRKLVETCTHWRPSAVGERPVKAEYTLTERLARAERQRDEYREVASSLRREVARLREQLDERQAA